MVRQQLSLSADTDKQSVERDQDLAACTADAGKRERQGGQKVETGEGGGAGDEEMESREEEEERKEWAAAERSRGEGDVVGVVLRWRWSTGRRAESRHGIGLQVGCIGREMAGEEMAVRRSDLRFLQGSWAALGRRHSADSLRWLPFHWRGAHGAGHQLCSTTTTYTPWWPRHRVAVNLQSLRSLRIEDCASLTLPPARKGSAKPYAPLLGACRAGPSSNQPYSITACLPQ